MVFITVIPNRFYVKVFTEKFLSSKMYVKTIYITNKFYNRGKN